MGDSVSEETRAAIAKIHAKTVRYWCPIEKKAMTGRGGRHTCPDCGAALMLANSLRKGGRRGR